jgi:hypothetical protein
VERDLAFVLAQHKRIGHDVPETGDVLPQLLVALQHRLEGINPDVRKQHQSSYTHPSFDLVPTPPPFAVTVALCIRALANRGQHVIGPVF